MQTCDNRGNNFICQQSQTVCTINTENFHPACVTLRWAWCLSSGIIKKKKKNPDNCREKKSWNLPQNIKENLYLSELFLSLFPCFAPSVLSKHNPVSCHVLSWMNTYLTYPLPHLSPRLIAPAYAPPAPGAAAQFLNVTKTNESLTEMWLNKANIDREADSCER